MIDNFGQPIVADSVKPPDSADSSVISRSSQAPAIMLSDGRLTFVDEEDFVRVSAYAWRPVTIKSTGATYAVTRIAGKMVYMHRLIANACSGEMVDHRDLDPLNNRRANLRRCTSSQNCCNRRLRSDSTTGFKGVSRVKQRFQATIKLHGKKISLGAYSTAQAAARAYDAAAVRLHGEFARLNFPGGAQ